MTEPAQPEREQRIEVEISPEIEPGVHADFASIWHTPATFVLDFASLRRPPDIAEDLETGREVVLLSARIVARVKIPPEQVFELAATLTRQLDAWEVETGRRPPQEPGLPNIG